MLMRREVAALLALLAGPAGAEAVGCPDLGAAFAGLTGYAVTAPPAGPEGEWCVLDRAVLTAEGAPDLVAERLRLRGQTADGALVMLALEAGGVRLAPGLSQGDLDPTLRETLRLQTAEVALVATVGPDGLALRDGRLRFSGGTEVTLAADVSGAGLSAGGFLPGRLTRATVEWRNDGKLLRPAMQAWGESLADGALGDRGVDAARLALQHLLLNMPDALFPDDGKERLGKLLEALPEGRGRLWLEFRSAKGIGAADVAIAVLSGDPYGPEAQAKLFGGAEVRIDWQPGLLP